MSGRQVTYVGADWAEFEFMRYRHRAALDELLQDVDAIVVVAGTPAMFTIAAKARPVLIGQVATTVRAERRHFIDRRPILRNLWMRLNTALIARLDLRSVRLPSVVIVENHAMKSWCEDGGANRVTLLTPGVDLGAFTSGAVDLEEKSGSLLCVGRLNDLRKDVCTLIRAYSHAVEVFGINQDLVLAGPQAPSEEVMELIEELGIASRIQLRINVSRDQLVRLYQQADLFVLTSLEEGLGLVFLESIACGVPVVATMTEGAQMVLDDSGCGRLVPFGDDLIPRFAKAIADFAKDEDLRLRASVAASARAEFFSEQDLGSKFVDLVNDVILMANSRKED